VIDWWIVNAVVGNPGSPETQSNAVYSCCIRFLSASRDRRSAAVDGIVFMTFSCKPDAIVSSLAIQLLAFVCEVEIGVALTLTDQTYSTKPWPPLAYLKVRFSCRFYRILQSTCRRQTARATASSLNFAAPVAYA